MATYDLRINTDARDDLAFLPKQAQTLLLEQMQTRLPHQPTTPTRNRKPLRPNPISSWELRVDRYRIFYDADDATREVLVKAVGWKEHERPSSAERSSSCEDG